MEESNMIVMKMSRKWTLDTIRNLLRTLEYLVNSCLGAMCFCHFLPGAEALLGWQLSWFSPASAFHEEELQEHTDKMSFSIQWAFSVCDLPFPPCLQFLMHFIVSNPVLQSTIHSVPPTCFVFFQWTGSTYRLHTMPQLDFVWFLGDQKTQVKLCGFPVLFKIPQFVTDSVCLNSQKRLSMKRLILIFQCVNDSWNVFLKYSWSHPQGATQYGSCVARGCYGVCLDVQVLSPVYSGAISMEPKGEGPRRALT